MCVVYVLMSSQEGVGGMLELVLEVVGVVLLGALVVIEVFTSVEVEAHNLLGEVLTTQLLLSPDRD